MGFAGATGSAEGLAGVAGFVGAVASGITFTGAAGFTGSAAFVDTGGVWALSFPSAFTSGLLGAAFRGAGEASFVAGGAGGDDVGTGTVGRLGIGGGGGVEKNKTFAK